MAHYTGADQDFYFEDVEMEEVREVNIPEDHPSPDTTHAGDNDGTSIPGGITYRNGCTATFVCDDGEATWDALAPGLTGTLDYYPLGKVSTKPHIYGEIVITNRTRVVSYSDHVVFTITFNFVGVMTETTYILE